MFFILSPPYQSHDVLIERRWRGPRLFLRLPVSWEHMKKGYTTVFVSSISNTMIFGSYILAIYAWNAMTSSVSIASPRNGFSSKSRKGTTPYMH